MFSTKKLKAYLFIVLAYLFLHPDFVKADIYELEPYSIRPDILALDAAHTFVSVEWSRLKTAQIMAVAEMFALHPPDTNYIFLGRDGEFMYDIARLATANTSLSNRISLLGISRSISSDSRVKNYLAENGLSETSLNNGEHFVFIDVGYGGSIPDKMRKLFPGFENQIGAHMLSSSNMNYPSSRMFLSHLKPEFDWSGEIHFNTEGVERALPKFTNTALRLEQEGNHLSPMSRATDLYQKNLTISAMRDLKATWSIPQIQIDFNEQITRLQTIKQLLLNGNETDIIGLREQLESLRNTDQGERLNYEVRAVFDSEVLGFYQLRYTPEALGLSDDFRRNIRIQPMSNEAKEASLKYPRWSKVLEERNWSSFIANNDLQELRQLIEFNIPEVQKYLFWHILKQDDSPKIIFLRQLMLSRLSVGDIHKAIKTLKSLPHDSEVENSTKVLESYLVSLSNRNHRIESCRAILI